MLGNCKIESIDITGDTWEAEDLRQEVLLKLYKAVENQPSREITNAYMYRIALNAWRDKKRKQDRSGSGPERTKAEQAEYGRLDFEALVDAFRRRDAKAICRCYRGLVQQQAFVSNVQLVGGKMLFHFTDPDGNRFMVTG
ncbi:sigma factor [Paenibacillus sp. 2TAB19]|uniref:sigma factor n=1 Tax=Paenibacillus sp. 2TAB19 TaxID=3233003 RepID=UPI003F95551D